MDGDQVRGWQPVGLDSWADLMMALRAVLAELPPGTGLLLSPDGDDRVARIVARPRPTVEVHVGDRRLASFHCDTHTDLLDHVERNIDDHWALATPAQLSYAYDGAVSARLRDALRSGDLVGDLPEGDHPRPGTFTAGESEDDELAGRLDPELLERLRRMGR